MSGQPRQSWLKAGDARAERGVKVDASFGREARDQGRREHLGCGASLEQHVRRHSLAGLDAPNAKTASENDAVPLDDRHRRTRYAIPRQKLADVALELGEAITSLSGRGRGRSRGVAIVHAANEAPFTIGLAAPYLEVAKVTRAFDGSGRASRG